MRRSQVDRTLVSAELSKSLLAANQLVQAGYEKQGVSEDSADGQSERVTAARMMGLVRQHGLQGALVKHRDGTGRDIHARMKQAGAERLRALVVNHQRGIQWSGRRQASSKGTVCG
jgi:hypothetical protein